jgi:hypothetical protein
VAPSDLVGSEVVFFECTAASVLAMRAYNKVLFLQGTYLYTVLSLRTTAILFSVDLSMKCLVSIVSC